jgi:hypothetical protein
MKYFYLILSLFVALPMYSQTQIGSEMSTGSRSFGQYSDINVDGNIIGVVDPVNGSGSNSKGEVSKYELTSSTWNLDGQPVEGISDGDVLGSNFLGIQSFVLDNSGNRMLVSSIEANNNAGYVMFLDFVNGNWTLNNSSIFDFAGSTFFGYSIEMSKSGEVAVVAYTISGTDFYIRTYERVNGIWTVFGTDFQPNTSSGFSATNLCLSTDGNKFVIFNQPGIIDTYIKNGSQWDIEGNQISGDFTYVELSGDGNKLFTKNPTLNRIDQYDRVGNDWILSSNFIEEPNGSTSFGSQISSSDDGNSLIVRGRVSNNVSVVYTYRFENGSWIQQNDVVTSTFDFGRFNDARISSDGSRFVVSGGRELNGVGSIGPGKVRVYETPNDIVLPVIYESIESNSINKVVNISWSISSSIENEKFVVQHSNDSQNWLDIGVIYQNETNSYGFTHPEPKPGINYYRIKQYDFSGEFTYSTVLVEKINRDFNIYPNPTSDVLYFGQDLLDQSNSYYCIYSNNGVKVMEGEVSSNYISVKKLSIGKALLHEGFG